MKVVETFSIQEVEQAKSHPESHNRFYSRHASERDNENEARVTTIGLEWEESFHVCDCAVNNLEHSPPLNPWWCTKIFRKCEKTRKGVKKVRKECL